MFLCWTIQLWKSIDFPEAPTVPTVSETRSKFIIYEFFSQWRLNIKCFIRRIKYWWSHCIVSFQKNNRPDKMSKLNFFIFLNLIDAGGQGIRRKSQQKLGFIPWVIFSRVKKPKWPSWKPSVSRSFKVTRSEKLWKKFKNWF